MDGHQFDQLARVVASGTSRRRVLGLLGAGIASVATHLSMRSASAGCPGFGGDCSEAVCCQDLICGSNDTCEYPCADIGEFCGLVPSGGPQPEIFCCSGICNQQGICESNCGGEGDTCGNPQAIPAGGTFPCCEAGLECIDETCQFPEPECEAEGDYCGPKSSECCQKGLECIDETCVVPEPECGGVGNTELDCCKGLICVDGACQEPEPECSELGGSCGQTQGSIDCCDDLVCVDGICTEPDDPCIDPGGSCEGDDDCCTGICCGGTCADIECCIDDPNPNDRCDEGTSCFEGICEGVSEICETDDDCGTGTCCCDDGSCSEDCCPEEEPVTELPNTGAGEGTSSRAGWFGAAAIGAAAAFLGSKKLKPDVQAAEIPDRD